MAQKVKHWDVSTWEVIGFDLSCPRPEILVIQPDRRRSRALAGVLVFMAIFFSVFALPPTIIALCMAGIVPPPSDGPLPTPGQNPALFFFLMTVALPALVAVVGPLIVLVHDEVLHRLTPITLDRSRDQLIYGRRVLCALSDIDRVILRKMLPKADARPMYGVALRLRGGRQVPAWTIRGIIFRYCLGYQDDTIRDTVGEIAAFIGARLEYREEWQDYGSTGGKGM